MFGKISSADFALSLRAGQFGTRRQRNAGMGSASSPFLRYLEYL